jgi:hypothetical protein
MNDIPQRQACGGTPKPNVTHASTQQSVVSNQKAPTRMLGGFLIIDH